MKTKFKVVTVINKAEATNLSIDKVFDFFEKRFLDWTIEHKRFIGNHFIEFKYKLDPWASVFLSRFLPVYDAGELKVTESETKFVITAILTKKRIFRIRMIKHFIILLLISTISQFEIIIMFPALIIFILNFLVNNSFNNYYIKSRMKRLRNELLTWR